MSYLVFLDLDNTLIKGQSQQLLVKYLFKKNKVNFFFVLKIYFWFFLYKLNFVKDVIKIREKSFKICKGWNIIETKKLLKEFFNHYIIKLFYKEALKIINFHKHNGGIIILVSASLLPLAEIVKEYLSLNYTIATNLEINGDFYTGKILGKVVYGENKVNLIKNFVKQNCYDLKLSYSYSDHYSDINLFKMVEYPVIVNPDNKLKKVALLKGWEIKIFNQ